MAIINITLRDETYQLEISDDRAINILKELGVLKDNKQFKIFGTPECNDKNNCCDELQRRKEIDAKISSYLQNLLDLVGNIKSSVDSLNTVSSDKSESVISKEVICKTNDVSDEQEIIKDVDAVIEQSKITTIKKYRGKISIYRTKIEEYGWDKFVDEYSRGIKTLGEFAELLDVKKQGLQQFLSSNGIKRVPELRHKKLEANQLKSNKLKSLREKIEDYGIDKLAEEYSTGLKNADDFAKLFETNKQNVLNFLSKNGIHKNKDLTKKNKSDKSTKKRAFSNSTDNSIKNKKAELSPVGTILHEENKKAEKTIKLENGICLKCGYRDRETGTCGYTMLTSKNRSGKKDECNHFVNVEDLL